MRKRTRLFDWRLLPHSDVSAQSAAKHPYARFSDDHSANIKAVPSCCGAALAVDNGAKNTSLAGKIRKIGHNALYVALAAALSSSLMPASALAEGQISELADVRASATVPVIDVAVSLSPEADGGGLLMDNADADAGIDVNHLSEMGSIAGEVSFDNNSNTSVRLARIESDATSLNTYFTGTSANIASFKLGSYDELSWSPASGAKTVYELATSDAADPSAGMIVPLGGTSSATLSLDVSGLSATSSAREAAKDPASARDLMSLTWVFEAAQTSYEQPGGIRDQIEALPVRNSTSYVRIDNREYYKFDTKEYGGHKYALMAVTTYSISGRRGANKTVDALRGDLPAAAQEIYENDIPSVKNFVVTSASIGGSDWCGSGPSGGSAGQIVDLSNSPVFFLYPRGATETTTYDRWLWTCYSDIDPYFDRKLLWTANVYAPLNWQVNGNPVAIGNYSDYLDRSHIEGNAIKYDLYQKALFWVIVR